MSTLTEVESVVKQLPPADKQKLLVFLAESLRTEGRPLPEPRHFAADELRSWIQEDERDLRELRDHP